MNSKLIIGGAIVIIAGLLILGRFTSKEAAGNWGNTDIQCLAQGHQNLAQHIHPNLFITVDGQPEPLPLNLGINESCMAEVHTHEEENRIHIESVTPKTFTLNDFFSVWGKGIEREGYTLNVLSDGDTVEDPANLELRDGQRIELNYLKK
ncbi:MAG TPA: hypothetical protein VEB18_03090 [Candidatus Paceibacterota bacterium]|nr:hypothetical protein [Candidatus Paceibacterota bacterium]